MCVLCSAGWVRARRSWLLREGLASVEKGCKVVFLALRALSVCHACNSDTADVWHCRFGLSSEDWCSHAVKGGARCCHGRNTSNLSSEWLARPTPRWGGMRAISVAVESRVSAAAALRVGTAASKADGCQRCRPCSADHLLQLKGSAGAGAHWLSPHLGLIGRGLTLGREQQQMLQKNQSPNKGLLSI